MKINIIKAHGTQNHFIIIYDKKNDPYLKKKETIQKLCQSANSKRIDGLLLLSDENQYDFKMDYYNNDGTWETLCLNGLRCASLLIFKKLIIELTNSSLFVNKFFLLRDAESSLIICQSSFASPGG